MNILSFLTDLTFGNKPQITVMHDGIDSKEIRICMDAGTIMKEHTAPGAITIMVLKGSVHIRSHNEEVTLYEGDMLYFDAKVPHSLKADEQVVIRLVLSKNDSAKRVQTLLKPL